MLRAALAVKDTITFEFKKKTYRIPHVIDNRYVLRETIDAGSFGTVFACQDTNTYDWKAIKFILEVN